MSEENRNSEEQKPAIENFDAESFMKAAGTQGQEAPAEQESPADAGDGSSQPGSQESPDGVPSAGEGDSGPPKIEDPYFQQLVTKYGQEGKYDLPEEIVTGKDKDGKDIPTDKKFEILQEHILRNNEPQIQDPFINEYMIEREKEDFDQKKFFERKMKEVSLMDMPAKDFLKEVYKRHSDQNKLNWGDDQIQSELDKMTDIQAEFEADKFRNAVKQQVQGRAANYFEHKKNDLQSQAEKYKEEITPTLEAYTNEIKDKKSIGGFEFSEEERNAFLKDLPSFMQKKVVDVPGEGPVLASEADIVLGEILSNPDGFKSILPFLYMVHNGKLEGAVSRAVEEKKEDLERRIKGERDESDQTGRGQHSDPGFDARGFIKAATGKK